MCYEEEVNIRLQEVLQSKERAVMPLMMCYWCGEQFQMEVEDHHTAIDVTCDECDEKLEKWANKLDVKLVTKLYMMVMSK